MDCVLWSVSEAVRGRQRGSPAGVEDDGAFDLPLSRQILSGVALATAVHRTLEDDLKC